MNGTFRVVSMLLLLLLLLLLLFRHCHDAMTLFPSRQWNSLHSFVFSAILSFQGLLSLLLFVEGPPGLLEGTFFAVWSVLGGGGLPPVSAAAAAAGRPPARQCGFAAGPDHVTGASGWVP